MPIILICGRPGSGKTQRAVELQSYLRDKHQTQSIIINEESLNIQKNEGYKDFHNEKITRGFLKSNVEKNLHTQPVVIFDSLNYIKGFRYEIFCLARACKSTYCILYCNTTIDACTKINQLHQNNFNEVLFQDLWQRMEVPKQKDRWDSPYFEVRVDERTPLEDIVDTLLFQEKQAKDPTATKQEIKHEGNYVLEQEKKIQEIIDFIVQNQQYCLESFNGNVKFNDSKLILKLERQISLVELRKIRLEFLNSLRVNPINQVNHVTDAFINFLQAALSRL